MQCIVARASKASKFPLIRIFVFLVTSAFLAGSISTGSEIIRKSHIKELAADVVYYESVFTAFKTRYQALPSDMINASSYWSKCRSNSAECNGDGDGDGDGEINSGGRILAYSKPEDGCLGNYSREILVDKEIAHYATNLSPDALCSVYFRLD